MWIVRALRCSTVGRSLAVAWVCGGLLLLFAAALAGSSPALAAQPRWAGHLPPAGDSPAAPQLVTATVRFAQAAYTVTVGDEFAVAAVVDDATELAGWQAVLVFDPTLLQVLEITGGGLITSTGRAETILGPWVEGPGRILMGAYTQGQAPGASGSDLLVQVRLRALTAGASALALEQVLLSTLDDAGQVDTQAATVTGAQVTIEAPVAVSLASFAAQAVAGGIAVTWETASELDNQGFNLYRAPDPAASPDLLAFIPSQAPGSSQAYAYEWLDGDVVPGQTYHYWLEDVDLAGVATRHGPVSATYQAPTAVTVADVRATVDGPVPVDGWIPAGVLVLIASAGLVVRRRRAM